MTEAEYRELACEPAAKQMTSLHKSELHIIAENHFWNQRPIEEARKIVWCYARDRHLDVDECEQVYDQRIREMAYIPTIGDK